MEMLAMRRSVALYWSPKACLCVWGGGGGGKNTAEEDNYKSTVNTLHSLVVHASACG
jgi:hypothetical protein